MRGMRRPESGAGSHLRHCSETMQLTENGGHGIWRKLVIFEEAVPGIEFMEEYIY